MPTYIYKCHKCGKVFEYRQRITADALTNCPMEICDQKIKGEGQVERQISKNIGLIFNGKGFYETDYKHSHTSAPAAVSNHSGNCACCASSDSCSSVANN